MAATAEKSRVYLVDVPGEAEKLIWQMQAQALAPLVAAGLRPVSVPALVHHTRRAHIRYLQKLRRASPSSFHCNKASDAAHPIEHVPFFRLGINAG